MFSIKKRFAVAALAALTTLGAGLSLASSDEEDEGLQPAAGMITKEQAIEKALAEHPGKVTKAYMEKEKGKAVWEVKINGDDGQEWEVYADARTGELVKSEAD